MRTGTHVFMSSSGVLFLAHPVSFLGGMAEAIQTLGGHCIALVEHDGYVLENPEYSEISYYFNRTCEKHFEDLGEL